MITDYGSQGCDYDLVIDMFTESLDVGDDDLIWFLIMMKPIPSKMPERQQEKLLANLDKVNTLET